MTSPDNNVDVGASDYYDIIDCGDDRTLEPQTGDTAQSYHQFDVPELRGIVNLAGHSIRCSEHERINAHAACRRGTSVGQRIGTGWRQCMCYFLRDKRVWATALGAGSLGGS